MIFRSVMETHPEILRFWHPTKNESLTPEMISCHSSKDIWWQCEKNHEWQSKPNSQIRRKTPCLQCKMEDKNKNIYNVHLSNYTSDNSEKWLNALTDPTEKEKVLSFSKWKSIIKNVQKGKTHKVSKQKTSFPQQAIHYYLVQIFGEENVKGNYKHPLLRRQDIDNYILPIHFAIEYDGFPYHARPLAIERDEKKSFLLKKHGIPLIRVRSKQLPKINTHGALILEHYDMKTKENLISLEHNVKDILHYVKDYIEKEYPHFYLEVSKKIKNLDINIERDELKIKRGHLKEKIKNSLLNLFPTIANEWHPTKNEGLLPIHFSAKSRIEVWWQCEKNHEWQNTIWNRTHRGDNCPYCSGHRVSDERCLASTHPHIAAEWHPTKNGDKTPYDFNYASHEEVWWKCTAKGHEWPTMIQWRTSKKVKHGCPYCSSKIICHDNCLATLFPEVAKQWHPTKNGDLTPQQVAGKAGITVWWQCEKGHEWPAKIANRTLNQGATGCPYCRGQKVCLDNCLATVRPDVAKEWHPTKNGDKTPYDFTYGSGQKVWWQCTQHAEHEWEDKIDNRTSHNRTCRFCKEEQRKLNKQKKNQLR